MKKILTVFIAAVMLLGCLTACKKEEETAALDSEYSGILTKVKLGMPLTKIITLQPEGVELYYETDTTIWSINKDTELMEIRDLLTEGEQFYYVDDSIITYNFKTVKNDEEIYLYDYVVEAHCLLDRETAEKYFDAKTAQLSKKHGVEATSTIKGTEDVDMELVRTSKYDCSSYTVTFSMTEKFDTVNGVDGYYGSLVSIEFKEKENKAETELKTDDKDKSKKDKKSDKKDDNKEED